MMKKRLKTFWTIVAATMFLMMPANSQAQPQTLTVYDGDLYQSVAPANIYFFSDYTKTQFVIPTDDLGAMAGGTISSMKFYTFPYNVPYTTGCPVDVYLKEVDYTTFDQNDPQFEPKATATVVYQGALEIVETGNGGELTITFSQPFPYTGGNLLVGMENTVKDAGKKTNIAFYGKMVMNSCVIGKSQTSLDDVPVSSDSPRSVIPKTTFFYTHSACDLPETLTAEGITAHEATLAWTGGSGTYNLEIKAEGGDWTRVLTETNTTSYTWENLSPGSYCQARVQSVCDNGVSGWKSLSFSAPYAEPHIIVYDGDESDVEAPAYIHKFRSYTKSQFVVPADNLGAMAGGTISSMKFYTLPLNVPYTTVCPVNVYLKEVGYTLFDQNSPQFESQAGATVVYQGTLEIKETTRGGELTISFSTPYSYTGGNLLVSIENTEKGSEEKEICFYGTSVPYASVYTSVVDQSWFIHNVHTHDFVPKTTFFYTSVGCGTPETLTAGNITAHEATLAWTGGSGTYNLEIKAEGGDWTPVLTETDATTHTLENLVQDTEYQARVQSVCDDTVSLWKNVSFSTVVVCPKPADLTVTFTEGNGTEATFSWSENGGSTWQLCLNGDEDNLIVPDSNPYTLTGLIPNTAYTAKVRAYCDDTYQSHWSNTVAFTPAKDFLTVYDGNNNSALVPANICSFHNNTRSQFVIPAADLSKMAEGTINSMKFYTTAQNIPYNTDCPVDVYVKEVDYTTFDQNDPQFEPQAGATVVYQGILKIVETGNGGELTISFSQPYPYTGGNLLVSIENTEKGGFMDIHFLGTSIGAMGTAIADWSQYDLESGTTIPKIIEFIPKTTFTYKSAICHAPTDLAVTLTEGDGTVATLDWTDNIVTTEWQICLNDDEDNLIVANSNPFTLTGLIPDSTYTAKVRAHCDDTGLSDWSNTVAFTPTNDKSLTVFESDDTEINMTVPAYINRFNYPTRSQFVIPDSTLSEMAGGAISSMKFYTRHGSYTTSSADVYLTEVDYTTFDGNNPQFEPKGSATIVYQGKLEIVQTGDYYDELTITFSTPYPYTGGNLLVGIENTNWQSGESKLIFFYGTIVQGASVAGYASSNPNPSNIMPTLRNFIPWTTFVYTPAGCFTPTDLAVTLTGGDGTVATLNWTDNIVTTEWQICLNDDEDNLIVANSNPFTLTGLIPDSTYTAKVRALYYGTGISDWSNTVTFTPTNDKSLTVFESDDTEIDMTVPAYIYKFNCPTRSQFVIPDSTLSEMAGGAISSMKFYTVTNGNIPYTIGCPVDVYVKEVDYTTFDENNPQFEPKATATVVYQGTLEIKETTRGGELTISFSTPYSYTGGNLLVGIENTSLEFDDIRSIAFCGKEVMGASVANYHFYYPSEIPPTQRNFIPMTTFVYTPAPQYIALHDNGDNSEIINEKAGTTTGVLLDGRTLYRDGRWNTICLPFSLDSLAGTPLADATVKELVSSGYNASTGTLTLNFATVSAIEAGKPYIVRWGGGDDDIDSPMFNDVTISSLPAGVTETQYTDFIGSYSTVSIAGENRTLLYMGGNSKLYYPNGAMNINAFRGYFQLRNGLTAGDLPTNGAKNIVLNFGDGETTTIGASLNDNGEMINDNYYLLDGRRLQGKPTAKGVYIVNGKKVVK